MELRLPSTKKLSQQTRSSLARLRRLQETQTEVSTKTKERRDRWAKEVKLAEEQLERRK